MNASIPCFIKIYFVYTAMYAAVPAVVFFAEVCDGNGLSQSLWTITKTPAAENSHFSIRTNQLQTASRRRPESHPNTVLQRATHRLFL